jgi:hypothetical protein
VQLEGLSQLENTISSGIELRYRTSLNDSGAQHLHGRKLAHKINAAVAKIKRPKPHRYKIT